MNVIQRSLVFQRHGLQRLLCFDVVNRRTDRFIQNRVEPDLTATPRSPEKIADYLWEKACEQDVMVRSLPKQTICKNIKQLVDLGCPENHICQMFDKVDSLKQLADIIELMRTLMEYGLNVEQASSVLSSLSHLSELSQEHITFCMTELHKTGWSSQTCVTIVVKYPNILIQDMSKLNTRITDLKHLFKTKDVLNLVEQSPQMVFCDWSYITERFNYVFHEMGITQRQMLYSKLFTYSMDHIHARHMFVVRAGFFKKIKKKGEQIDTNPSLDTIIDSSDREFAKQFGEMTKLDYQTFKQLLVREQTSMVDFKDDN